MTSQASLTPLPMSPFQALRRSLGAATARAV
jgi:hypothetical protein